MNRFKALDLVNRVPEELWIESCNIVQEAEKKKNHSKEKEKKEGKVVIWLQEALQISEERREVKSKGERERYIQLNAEFQRIAPRDKKAFLNEQCIKLE